MKGVSEKSFQKSLPNTSQKVLKRLFLKRFF
jgi:hypothetical protein